jgi:plastocyanin
MRRAPLASIALALALAGCLALALAGCGKTKSGSTGAVTLKPRQPLALDAHEYGFKPGTVTIASGGESALVRFDLHNGGTLPHDVHVRQGSRELGGTPAIGEGKSASATVTLAPGDYEFYCSIGDHATLGMKGKLTIQ